MAKSRSSWVSAAIDVYIDHVVFDGVRYDRPPSMPRGAWEDFWRRAAGLARW